MSEDLEGILRRAKESLDGIVLKTGGTFVFHGVTRKKISGSKRDEFLIGLNGQDFGEAFANKTFTDEVSYHSTSFKGPIIDILYKKIGERKKDGTK